MTGNIRYNLGLLVVALIAALVGWFLLRIPEAEEVGGVAVLGAILLGLVGLVRIATDLLRTPQRD